MDKHVSRTRAPRPPAASAGALAVAALAAAALATPVAALAQAWPAKPVKVIAPFAPGGTADTMGRLVSQKLSETLKQQFVVENRAGAGGVIGSESVARAAPDGYTLVVSGVASHVLAPVTAKVPYDPVRDFTHIANFGGPPAVFAITPGIAARDLKEFVDLAKAAPGRYSFGSPGNGTQGHLVAELFKQLAGIQIQHVPYKGASGAVADLIAGHLPSLSTTLSTASGQIRAGKARALAISSAQRLADYPDVPTFRESGYPDLVATVWFSLSGPAGMAPDVVTRLNAEVRTALRSADLREKIRPEGIEPVDMDVAAFNAFFNAEVRRWTPVVRAAGLKPD
jgi:tripartite-type tricarboxylate transporter receptor subunit TctC